MRYFLTVAAALLAFSSQVEAKESKSIDQLQNYDCEQASHNMYSIEETVCITRHLLTDADNTSEFNLLSTMIVRNLHDLSDDDFNQYVRYLIEIRSKQSSPKKAIVDALLLEIYGDQKLFEESHHDQEYYFARSPFYGFLVFSSAIALLNWRAKASSSKHLSRVRRWLIDKMRLENKWKSRAYRAATAITLGTASGKIYDHYNTLKLDPLNEKDQIVGHELASLEQMVGQWSTQLREFESHDQPIDSKIKSINQDSKTYFVYMLYILGDASLGQFQNRANHLLQDIIDIRLRLINVVLNEKEIPEETLFEVRVELFDLKKVAHRIGYTPSRLAPTISKIDNILAN